ncbi:MAG TPA: hypothetical protein PKC32_00220 [Sphingopyxis sp.]|nr:hypothetical protein [Sphingopyxis sp.]
MTIDPAGQHACDNVRIQEGRLAVRDADGRSANKAPGEINVENGLDRFVDILETRWHILRDR